MTFIMAFIAGFFVIAFGLVLKRNFELKSDIVAIEQGTDEVADAYYTDQLQWNNTRDSLQGQLQREEARNDSLALELRKSNEMRDMYCDRMEEAHHAGLMMQRELNKRQEIIDRHNKECLPVFDELKKIEGELKEMEDVFIEKEPHE